MKAKESMHVGGFTIRPQTVLLGLAFLALVIYPWVLTNPFPRHLMIMLLLYAMMGLGWNILGGFAGQISVGHGIYFGLGAYTSTMLLMKLGITPWVGMLGGVLVAELAALVVGYACFRLGGRYFSMATLVIGEIGRIVFTNFGWVGGAVGLFLPVLEESVINFQFHASKIPYYYIILAFTVLATVTTYVIAKTRLGYYFRAVRDDPDAARSLGIDITRYKLIALGISVFFTAIGGSFYAQYILFIDPISTMNFMISLTITLLVVLGGMGTLWGPIIGAFVLIPITELTRVYWGGAGRAIDLVIYGALIVLIAIYQPQGLVAMVERYRRKLRNGSTVRSS